MGLLEGLLVLELRIAGEIYQHNPPSFSLSDIQSWSGIKSDIMVGNIEDMGEFWRGCDITILPSYCKELPKFLLEVADCGLPLLGPDVAGIRKIILHGSKGLLFVKGNKVDIASMITQMGCG